VGEHHSNGERKYFLSDLSADTRSEIKQGPSTRADLPTSPSATQKEELGRDHFEGRSWALHRHALRTMMAYAFLQSRRLAQTRRKKQVQTIAPA
jgi:SRSO17 transposase